MLEITRKEALQTVYVRKESNSGSGGLSSRYWSSDFWSCRRSGPGTNVRDSIGKKRLRWSIENSQGPQIVWGITEKKTRRTELEL